MRRVEGFALPKFIPSKELDELMEFISAQFFMICARWKEYFIVDTIQFYC